MFQKFAILLLSSMNNMRSSYHIIEEPLSRLDEYGEVPIRFEVLSIFEVRGNDPDSALLVEKPVAVPWVKDYDTLQHGGPMGWTKRWDVSNWGMLAAYRGERRIGGTVLAYNTDGVYKLEGRDDLVFMWDLRVCSDERGRGVGRQLFEAAVDWARERQCLELKVETQNINVPACRFYQRQGCHLSSIDRDAYRAFPEEIELIWTFNL